MSELSARTRAEMYRGGASVGTTPKEVDDGIALARAWGIVNDFVAEMRFSGPSLMPTVKAMVWQRPEGIMVEPYIMTEGKKTLSFDEEPIDVFPSAKLRAQLMLVLG